MSTYPVEGWATVRDLRMRYLDWGRRRRARACPARSGFVGRTGMTSSRRYAERPLPHHRSRTSAGHGQTTQANEGYGWHSVASDAVGLLDVLEIEKAIVFGHSWGGNVAVGLAAHYPERVSALVMIDGGFFSPQMLPGATWEAFSQRTIPARCIRHARRVPVENERAACRLLETPR